MSDKKRLIALVPYAVMLLGMVLISGASKTARAEDKNPLARKTAGFYWEINEMTGTEGADAFFAVKNPITIKQFDLDVSTVPLKVTGIPGFEQIIASASVTPHPPTFDDEGHVLYPELPASPDFTDLTIENPHKIPSIYSSTHVLEGLLAAVIVKSWVPTNGTSSQASRHAARATSLCLEAGSYLTFHMAHFGRPMQAEMQVTFEYLPGCRE